MKIFWKAQTLEVAESDIFSVKSGANHDAEIENWLQLFFFEIYVFVARQQGKGVLKHVRETRNC